MVTVKLDSEGKWKVAVVAYFKEHCRPSTLM
jgi:hypothetical protein